MNNHTAKSLNWMITQLKAIPATQPLSYTVKDNFCIKGVQQTCGSRIKWIPSHTADCVTILGTDNLVATTNMDEFSSGSYSDTGHLGPVRCPETGGRLNAGSSGGSAVSCVVAVDFSLGTDTGGSVRSPAVACKIYGLKPTYDRISRRGVVAFACSLDTVGIMSKRLDVVESVFRKLALTRAEQPTQVERVGFWQMEPMSIGRRHIRIGKCDLPMASDPLAASAYTAISSVELMSNLLRFSGLLHQLNPNLKARILAGRIFCSSERVVYERACKVRRLLVDEMNRADDKYDVIISPCEERYYPIANLTGRPALVIPSPKLHLIGKVGQDERLLEFAKMFDSRSS